MEKRDVEIPVELDPVELRQELGEFRQMGMPEEIRNSKLVDVHDEYGEPVIGKYGYPQKRLVPRDDGYGPNSGDRKPRQPLPNVGGAAVELALEESK